MKRTIAIFTTVVVIAALFFSLPAKTIAQIGPGAQAVRLFFTTNTLGTFTLTPYLRSAQITATGTLNPKTTVGILGCVIVGVAGAAGSTIKIYNGTVVAENLLATVDGTVAGGTFCYGMIFNEGLNIVTASSGASPDAVVTWR